MLQFAAPVFVEDKFDDHGKWMDGWETRRKRHAGYDWAIVQLGVAGKIQALDIDTTFLAVTIPLQPVSKPAMRRKVIWSRPNGSRF